VGNNLICGEKEIEDRALDMEQLPGHCRTQDTAGVSHDRLDIRSVQQKKRNCSKKVSGVCQRGSARRSAVGGTQRTGIVRQRKFHGKI